MGRATRDAKRDALLAGLRCLAEALNHQGDDRDALLRVAARYLSRALWGEP
jgi:hypothetical protein